MSGGARIKLSLLLLVPIVVATIALAARVNLRAALSVDNRQYVEMATGVRAHGLPYTLNGYSEDFPEARPAFKLAVDGRLWGNYPPLFAYVGAAALHFGELAGIARANFIVIALFAWLFFREVQVTAGTLLGALLILAGVACIYYFGKTL